MKYTPFSSSVMTTLKMGQQGIAKKFPLLLLHSWVFLDGIIKIFLLWVKQLWDTEENLHLLPYKRGNGRGQLRVCISLLRHIFFPSRSTFLCHWNRSRISGLIKSFQLPLVWKWFIHIMMNYSRMMNYLQND